MAPCWGINILLCSSQLLPRLCLGPLKGFWAVTVPFKSPRLALCVAFGPTGKQGHSQACHDKRIGPKRLSKTADQTLIECLLKTHFLHWYLMVKSQQNRMELVTRPEIPQCLTSPLANQHLRTSCQLLNPILSTAGRAAGTNWQKVSIYNILQYW